MSLGSLQQVVSALGEFASVTRLYELTLEGADATLLVEAFAAEDGLQSVGQRDLILLSTNAYLDLAKLLGQQAVLEASLADGTRTRFTGLVTEAAMLGSFGGLARYRLRLQPWLWRLGQVRNSRVWQDKTVIEIVESVFQSYAPLAQWRWSDETASIMAGAGARSYCCQYRESDLDFITRLLTEEGLAWRFEEIDGGQSMVLFANSSNATATPADASSESGGGIRFHGARVGESADTIQALRAHRSLRAGLSTVLSYDYKSKKAVAASVPTQGAVGGARAPRLESYDTPGQYFYANGEQAQRYALLQMEANEARRHLWDGRSTVRTLRAGTRFTLTQGPLGAGGEDQQYVVLRVVSVGVNNLPTPAKQGLAELFGPIPELLDETMPEQPDNFAAVIAQASDSGYANHFEAIAAATPWRPVIGENGLRHHPKPTAHGSQSAIVVGAGGGNGAAGADEIYCDNLGRVRIAFHWQQDANATCWVRVAQRSAGGGMGSQFLPRIGQEVLVQFLENDIDRPIIVGALYNGQGEGGQLPTPGGKSERDSDTAVFQSAHDHGISGQGNLAGGNSPLWHGAAADNAGHRNSAAQWGIRSKEFGGAGYNQLLFDDTDNQGRIHLKSSHAASELTLGHLIHAADNYRGSLRGTGAELRTDGYGAVRAGAGLLVSSYKITHSPDSRDPAGDNSAGMALLKQAATLAQTFSDAAKTHETVALASHLGAAQADSSVLDDKAAPIKALQTATSGMLNQNSVDAAKAEAPQKPVAPADDKLPHTTDAIIAIAAKAGLGVLSGENLQLANGETITLMSGQDTQFATGGQMRVHSGQAIGLLGGAMKAGEANVGLQMIAAKGAIELQAHADVMNVQARDEVNIVSANAHIDWAAARSISLSTLGGANITIAGGNITVQCPGKITIHAGKKSFTGPVGKGYPLPELPRSALPVRDMAFNLRLADTPGPNGHALSNTPWKIAFGAMPDGMAYVEEKQLLASGLTDDEGNIKLTPDQEKQLAKTYAGNPDSTWIVYPGHVVRLRVADESPDWTEKEKLFHALNSADFSTALHGTIFDDAALSHTSYAKTAFDVLDPKTIFAKIKV
ncbi:type VI secretion system VgrG family protein [Duganella sp. 3397]|uniref:type VI secretion system Vgr family protein n=1 Tax=Duganella sp. 3397 TaxID=2817732 RepID=UPI00286018D8|nr:type VI secretion system Vgr family protein [Duganella sp. 3397]MDR7049121.1 type VI secretion system VgrG family protein [Duganella sp. 3397]